MGKLEMIPREFWLEIYRELIRVAPKLLKEEKKMQEQAERMEAERLARLHRQYDEAAKRKKRAMEAERVARYKQKKT